MDSGDEKRLGVLGWLAVAGAAAVLWVCGAICLLGGLVLAITGLVVATGEGPAWWGVLAALVGVAAMVTRGWAEFTDSDRPVFLLPVGAALIAAVTAVGAAVGAF